MIVKIFMCIKPSFKTPLVYIMVEQYFSKVTLYLQRWTSTWNNKEELVMSHFYHIFMLFHVCYGEGQAYGSCIFTISTPLWSINMHEGPCIICVLSIQCPLSLKCFTSGHNGNYYLMFESCFWTVDKCRVFSDNLHLLKDHGVKHCRLQIPHIHTDVQI